MSVLWSSGKNVTPSTLVLNIGIRLTLNHLLNLESSFTSVACHLVGTEKEEIHRDHLPPPFVQMNGVVANVKGQQ